MKIFVTSDCPYSHQNILKYEPNRPGSNVDEMNEILFDNWNSVVSSCDEVYILGDFAMGLRTRVPEYWNRLNGRKHLIFGNHDQRKNFDFVETTLKHEILEYHRDVLREKPILFIHDPHRALEMDLSKYSAVFSGHVHSLWKLKKAGETLDNSHGEVFNPLPCPIPFLNVGVDVHNYFPILLEDAIAMVSL